MSKKISPSTKAYLTDQEFIDLKKQIYFPVSEDWWKDENAKIKKRESGKVKHKIYVLAKQLDIKGNPKMLPVFVLKIKAYIRQKQFYSERI